MMRTGASAAALLGRAVAGGYLAAHGAQKLFGSFGGHGIEATAAGFERLGLTPAREMATLAGAVEVGGGLLTATGIGHPLGPVSLAGTMAVATAVHRKNGPLSAKGGYELPLTNLALTVLLAATGPGPLRLGSNLPRTLAIATTAGAIAITAASVAKVVNHRPPTEPAPSQAATSTTA